MKRILDEAYRGAEQILTEHRDQLERVARELLKQETLDAAAFKALLGQQAVAVNGPPP